MTRQARTLDDVELPPWRFVAFADLHVAPATLDRALAVLRRVGDLAIAHEARILCLGDFFDIRGSVQVRIVDALMAEFDRWRDAGIEAVFIPGNHDQVTVSGAVHGLRMFDAYPNIQVATEPLFWHERQIAFLPWREDPEEQAEMFAAVEPGWTIFGHAEAQGAISNSGKPMAGRFELSSARAVYLGHFHKRQLIGDRCWYIGSPFEMDMGERGDPHGVALISQDDLLEPTTASLEPAWIDFEDFPKHHRLLFGESWDLGYIRETDFVEVAAAPEEIGTEAFRAALDGIPADHIKPLPIKVGVGDGAPPAFALRLDEAVERWVGEFGFDADRAAKLKLIGRELLKDVPDAKAIVPISPSVSVVSVTVEGFCAIRGTLDFEFPQGEVLVRGAMGSGKTSVMDAMTWCLFGRTSPRRAGSHGASLRADDVIHDDCESCAVTVAVQCGTALYEVHRAKARGSGARIRIFCDGEQIDGGISDQQDQIHRIVGINHDLWRACVYLGQGAVGTWVTDADKSRKALLSTAFGLDACPVAQKEARARWKKIAVRSEAVRRVLSEDARAIEELRAADFAAEIEEWTRAREDQLSRIKAQGAQLSVTAEQIKGHLASEGAWLESKAKHETHIDKLTKSLAAAAPRVAVANLQREIGAIQAERSIVDRDLGQAKRELEAHVSGGGNCPTCGKPFDSTTAEQHAEELERKVQSKALELQTWDVKLSNVAQKLEDANAQSGVQTKGIAEEITQSRESLAKCSEALNQFARLKANALDTERRLHDLRAEYSKAEQAPNPYLAKQAEKEERVKTLEAKTRADTIELEGATGEQENWGFWDQGFGPKGLPVLVLRAALHELETYANRFLAALLGGRVYCRLAMETDALQILFYEYSDVDGTARERRYEQLSGGQRRCVELAFNPFALSEMVFSRCGVRVSLLVVDELTAHLGQAEKPLICEILRGLDRDSIVVIDHDPTVQGAFDHVIDLTRIDGQIQLARAL